MKKNLLRVAVLVVACALTLSVQAFAGNSQRKATVSAGGKSATSQGTSKKSMRQLGAMDGSCLTPRPQDGTGNGSPANK